MLSLTAILILLPLAAGTILLTLKGEWAKKTAFVFSIAELAVIIGAASCFDPSGGEQFSTNLSWITSLGINFHVGLDGIGLVLVLLTAFLVPLIILSSFENRPYSENATFYALIFFMQSALIGVFTSYDCFLFYVFWEAALIPVYFIAAIWGGPNRLKVTLKFFIYTIFGSLFMLLGIIYLYLQTPYPHNFDLSALSAIELTCAEEPFVFALFMLAFAIKMPIFPFHTWQPDTYTESPTPATMLLSGIMLKMGLFGIIRWIIPVMPGSFYWYAGVIIFISIAGIVYASVIAIKQKDFKRLVAFSSIAHVGLISAGLFSGNIEGLQGAVIQMLNHGINVIGLFFVLEIIAQRTGTRNIEDLGGIVHKAPVLSIFFIIILLGTVALPLTNGFTGEFLLLFGVFQFNPFAAAVAGLTIILGAVYMLRMYKNIMLGETNSITSSFTDVTVSEFTVLAIISTAVLVLGVYPNLILQLSEPTAKQLVDLVGEGCSMEALVR